MVAVVMIQKCSSSRNWSTTRTYTRLLRASLPTTCCICTWSTVLTSTSSFHDTWSIASWRSSIPKISVNVNPIGDCYVPRIHPLEFSAVMTFISFSLFTQMSRIHPPKGKVVSCVSSTFSEKCIQHLQTVHLTPQYLPSASRSTQSLITTTNATVCTLWAGF